MDLRSDPASALPHPAGDEGVGHAALDRELRFVAVNEVLAALNGRPAAEHLGRSVAEVLPALAPALEPLLRRVLRTGQPLEGVELQGASPGRRWLAGYYPVLTRFGVVLGVEVVVRAAPPRAAPEAAALQWDAATIFAQAPIGIIISDLAGNLLDCNPAFCALAGYSLEALRGLSPAALTHPDDLAADQEAVGRVLGGAQPVAVQEKRYLRPDGSVIWVQITRTVITDESGAPRRGLAFVEDITGRRQIEAAERAARAEAERSVALRDEFLAVASHELKTPLAVVMGQAQLMQRRDEREGLLGERDRQSIAMVADQARRLNRMIGALLDVTRVATGQLQLAPAPIDLGAIVRQVVEELRPTAPRHRVELTLPDGPVAMVGDELRLGQAISNLVQNAIKYSPRGGRVAVALAADAAKATLTVSDEGIGIPAAALGRLFERYYRAPNTSSARAEGIGVGLYLVREIVDRHGGAVAVASEEGAGTTFTLTLPR